MTVKACGPFFKIYSIERTIFVRSKFSPLFHKYKKTAYHTYIFIQSKINLQVVRNCIFIVFIWLLVHRSFFALKKMENSTAFSSYSTVGITKCGVALKLFITNIIVQTMLHIIWKKCGHTCARCFLSKKLIGNTQFLFHVLFVKIDFHRYIMSILWNRSENVSRKNSFLYVSFSIYANFESPSHYLDF